MLWTKSYRSEGNYKLITTATTVKNTEEKLAKYRSRQERHRYVDEAKQRIKSFFTSLKEQAEEDAPDAEKLITDDARSETSATSDVDDSINCCTRIDLLYYFLLFLIWATLYVIFIEYQFGTVYLVVTALIGIYFNTRTKPRRPGEVSAYSVFNKDCKSIDGTLKAEQFERELRYGR